MVTKKPEGENDVRDKTSDDEEENPKALGEDRNKTMIATWGIMELNTSMTLLQGETIERGVFVIKLKVLVLGNKETAKRGYLRGKYEHETHDGEGGDVEGRRAVSF